MPANERSKNRKSAVTWTGPKQGGFAMNANQPNNAEEPLSSWKEIGAYLQRNEATARRWEKKRAFQSTGIPTKAGAACMLTRARSIPGGLNGGWRLSRRRRSGRGGGQWRSVCQ